MLTLLATATEQAVGGAASGAIAMALYVAVNALAKRGAPARAEQNGYARMRDLPCSDHIRELASLKEQVKGLNDKTDSVDRGLHELRGDVQALTVELVKMRK